MNTEQTNENILRYSPPNTSVFLIICLEFVLIDGVTMFEGSGGIKVFCDVVSLGSMIF